MLTATPTILLGLAFATLLAALAGWFLRGRKARSTEIRLKRIQSDQFLELDEVYAALDSKKAELERLHTGDTSEEPAPPHPLDERRKAHRTGDPSAEHLLEQKDELLESHAERAREFEKTIGSLTSELEDFRKRANAVASGRSPLTNNKGPEDEYANELRARDIKIKMLELELANNGGPTNSSQSVERAIAPDNEYSALNEDQLNEVLAQLSDEHAEETEKLQCMILLLRRKALEQQNSLTTLQQQYRQVVKEKFGFAKLLKKSVSKETSDASIQAVHGNPVTENSNENPLILRNFLTQSKVAQLKLARELNLHKLELKKQTESKLNFKNQLAEVEQNSSNEIKRLEISFKEANDQLSQERLSAAKLQQKAQTQLQREKELQQAHDLENDRLSQHALQQVEQHKTEKSELEERISRLNTELSEQIEQFKQFKRTHRQDQVQVSIDAKVNTELLTGQLETLKLKLSELDELQQATMAENDTLMKAQNQAKTAEEKQSIEYQRQIAALRKLLAEKEGVIRDRKIQLQTSVDEVSQLNQQLKLNLNEFQTQKDQLETRLYSESNKNRELSIIQHRCRSLETALSRQVDECRRLREGAGTENSSSTGSTYSDQATAGIIQQNRAFQQANAELADHAKSLEQQIEQSQAALGTCNTLVAKLQYEAGHSRGVSEQVQELRDQYQLLYSLYRDLQQHNKTLQKETRALRASATSVDGGLADKSSSRLAANDARVPTRAKSHKPKKKTRSSRSLKSVKNRKKPSDDLKLIYGIGPVIEKLLRENGLRTFKQIAELDEAAVENLAVRLGAFGGRITRDDWIGCAKRLIEARDAA